MIRKYLTVSNVIFLLLLGVLFYKPARLQVQAWVMDWMGSPAVLEESKNIAPEEMNFIFYNLEGDTFNLLDMRGKPMFINFWATWCGPCMAEMPSIEKLVKAHNGTGHIILLSHEKPEVLREYQKNRDVKLPIYYAKSVPSFVTSESIPLTFILDKDGNIVLEKSGSADWSDPHIAELLK